MQDLEEGKFCPLKKYGESAGFWIIHETLLWGNFSSKASAISFAQSLGWQEFHIGFGGVRFFQYKPQLFANGWRVANVVS